MKLKYTIFNLETKNDLLVTREMGKGLKDEICDQLDSLASNNVLTVDFSRIQFIDASCADEIAGKVMARLQAGEFRDRYVIYRNIAEQHFENLDLALKVTDKVIIAYSGRKWLLLGQINDGYRRALQSIIEAKEITARELQQSLGYKTVNEASTKLSRLYEMALIAREPFRESVRGGGRQFRYLSLLKDIEDDRDQFSQDVTEGMGIEKIEYDELEVESTEEKGENNEIKDD